MEKENSNLIPKFYDILNLNNKCFKSLKKPTIFSFNNYRYNYEMCIKFYRELVKREENLKHSFVFYTLYIKELDKFVNERSTIEKNYYNNIKENISQKSIVMPQPAPEDAGFAQVKSIEEKKYIYQNLLDSLKLYNEQIRIIINYYDDNYNQWWGLPGYLTKDNLPAEIDANEIFK